MQYENSQAYIQFATKILNYKQTIPNYEKKTPQISVKQDTNNMFKI